jgi:hypothetical protein
MVVGQVRFPAWQLFAKAGPAAKMAAAKSAELTYPKHRMLENSRLLAPVLVGQGMTCEVVTT